MTSLCLLCGRPQISCYPRTHFVQVSFSPFSVQTLWRHQPRVAVLGYAKMVSPGWQGEPTTENCVDLVGWTVWLVDLRHSDYQRRQDTRKFPRQGRPHQRWDSYDNGTGNDLKRELFIIPPPPTWRSGGICSNYQNSNVYNLWVFASISYFLLPHSSVIDCIPRLRSHGSYYRLKCIIAPCVFWTVNTYKKTLWY